MSRIINILLRESDQGSLREIQQLPISAEKICILISGSIREVLQLPEGRSPQARALI
jgi:hypothetical protein